MWGCSGYELGGDLSLQPYSCQLDFTCLPSSGLFLRRPLVFMAWYVGAHCPSWASQSQGLSSKPHLISPEEPLLDPRVQVMVHPSSQQPPLPCCREPTRAPKDRAVCRETHCPLPSVPRVQRGVLGERYWEPSLTFVPPGDGTLHLPKPVGQSQLSRRC